MVWFLKLGCKRTAPLESRRRHREPLGLGLLGGERQWKSVTLWRLKISREELGEERQWKSVTLWRLTPVGLGSYGNSLERKEFLRTAAAHARNNTNKLLPSPTVPHSSVARALCCDAARARNERNACCGSCMAAGNWPASKSREL
jgi:hypothetical protein